METVKKVSFKFKDRLSTPLETAIFWIEYVIRHNGAPELRTVGADLPWYQYFLVDVISIIVASVIAVFVVLYYLAKWLTHTLLNVLKHKIKQKRS